MSQPSSLTRRLVHAASSRQTLSNDNSLVDTIIPRGGDAITSDSSVPLPPRHYSSQNRLRKDSGDGNNEFPFSIFGTNATMAALPNWTGWCLKTMLGMTVALYVLNQKHMLPKPLGAVVSKMLFWPTLPITASRRIGSWTTVVDDTVIIGGAPFGFVGFPERLYEEYGVSFTQYSGDCSF